MSKIVDFNSEKFKIMVEKCSQQLGGAVTIDYNKGRVMAPRVHVDMALEELLRLDFRSRKKVVASVNKEIKKEYKYVIKGKASQEEALDFMYNLVIWYANEIIRGKVNGK